MDSFPFVKVKISLIPVKEIRFTGQCPGRGEVAGTLSPAGGVFEEQPDSDGLLQDLSPWFITTSDRPANISHTDPPPPRPLLC